MYIFNILILYNSLRRYFYTYQGGVTYIIGFA